jgi:hypothetical protein
MAWFLRNPNVAESLLVHKPTALPGAMPFPLELTGFAAVVPPAGVSHALKQCRWMLFDEMDVAADGFFEQLEHAMPQVFARHRHHGIMGVLCEVEDHECILGKKMPSIEDTGCTLLEAADAILRASGLRALVNEIPATLSMRVLKTTSPPGRGRQFSPKNYSNNGIAPRPSRFAASMATHSGAGSL